MCSTVPYLQSNRSHLLIALSSLTDFQQLCRSPKPRLFELALQPSLSPLPTTLYSNHSGVDTPWTKLLHGSLLPENTSEDWPRSESAKKGLAPGQRVHGGLHPLHNTFVLIVSEINCVPCRVGRLTKMDQNGGNISLDQTTEEYDQNVGMDVGLAPHSAHVLLLPHPAVPHITPMVHLAHQLVSHGAIKCTVLSFDFLLDKVPKGGLSDGIILLGLAKNLTGFSENVTSDSPSPVQDDEELHCTARAYIEKLLQEKAAGIRVPVYTCVISDYIQGWSIDLCSKLGIPRYLFVASSAFNFLVASSAYLILDTEEGADSRKVNSWLTDSSIPRVTQNCGYLPSVATRKFLCIDPRSYSGVLINTFYEFETHSIDYLRNMGQKVTTVGPLQSSVQVSKVSFGNDKYVDDECLQWLGKQPVKSVLYVNFGTTGFNAFTIQMVHEMALGLEASQARFLWVFRPPPNCKPDELDKVLPNGFEERVKDRGKISRGWAPQIKILEHPSTAAFFMQCGWNSTLESVARGIPFIGWPTYADQPFNGRYAAEVSKVGLLLPQNEKAVDRHDVELAVRTIMFSEKGMLLMKRAEEMEIAAAKALKPGGSTHKSFLDFIDIIRPS